MFIGTQFSNLYTLVDTSARGRVGYRFLERGPVLDLAREVQRAVFVISALARGHADATRGSRTWERGP
jgi:hypothetical protein